MPPRARARHSLPLKAIQPTGRPSKMATPVVDHRRKGSRRQREPSPDSDVILAPSSSDSLPPPRIHTFPTEILSAVLSLAEHSSEDAVDAQNQRFSHALVCKAWNRLVAADRHGGETMNVRGFKTARRLMRVYNAEPERAAGTKRLSVDLEREERPGTNAMVADVVSACEGLRELELRFLGRAKGSIDAACLTVGIYDAVMSRSELVELSLSFRRVWTGLTLGGDLTRALTSLTKVRRLNLPLIVVPRTSPSFPFSPALTHLALHLTGGGSLLLLAHLLSTSRESLLHLSLTVHAHADLSTLPALLASVAAQLLSFSLDAHDPAPGPDEANPAAPIPFASILTPLARLSTLALADSLSPPLDVLSTLPRLRHLAYRLSSPAALHALFKYLQAAPRGPNGITGLELRPSSAWREVKSYYDDFRHEDLDLARAPETRGIVVVALETDGPTEEDEYEEPEY